MTQETRPRERTSPPTEGDLKTVPFAALVADLARHERTAVLSLERRPVTKEIVFEYGVPVDCRSNLVTDTLSRFMVAQGRLDREQHDALLRESINREVPMGKVLREHGVLDSAELFRTLQANLARKLLDVFTWPDGAYRVTPHDGRVDSPLKVKPGQLVLTGVTRFAPQAEVNAGVWPLVSRPLGIHPEPVFALDDFKLNDRQRAVLDSLVKPRNISELSQETGVAFEEITRLVYALALLGVLAPVDELPAARPKPVATPAAPRPDAPEGVEIPSDPAEVARRKNDIMEAYLAHRRQDAFDLLELPESAGVSEVRQAYLRFARRYAPWHFSGTALASVVDEARDLFMAGARAYSELMDAETRNTLLYRRQVLRKEAERPQPTSMGIQTDLLDPDKQYRRGKALFDEGQHREALSLLEFAADCDAQNALYRAEAAYCRFVLDPALHGEKALEDLEAARRIDPACGLAAYYAGEVARVLGDYDRAEHRLRLANQLMAPDRRPIEALKTLARDRGDSRSRRG